MAETLLTQRDRIAAAFYGRWWRAVFAAALNRMFDYAALVAALVAFGAHVRPAEVLLATSSRRRSRSSRSLLVGSDSWTRA